MSSIDRTAVRKMFRASLFAVTGMPSIDRLQVENRKLDPPALNAANPMWVREWLTVFASQRSTAGYVEHVGEYRLDLVVPVNHGTEDPEALAKALLGALEPPKGLTDTSGNSLWVERSYSSNLMPGSGSLAEWTLLPVMFNWRAQTPAG